jgi:hypothetical protein
MTVSALEQIQHTIRVVGIASDAVIVQMRNSLEPEVWGPSITLKVGDSVTTPTYRFV